MTEIADRWAAFGSHELGYTSHDHARVGCQCASCFVTTGWVLKGEFCDEQSSRLGLSDRLHHVDRDCAEYVFDFDTIRTLARAPRDIATLLDLLASRQEGR